MLNDDLDLRRKKTDEVREILADKSYDTVDGDSSYKYLVKLPMDSVTEENVEKLLKEKGEKESALEELHKTTETQMWLAELTELRSKYILYKEARQAENIVKSSDKVIKKKKKLKLSS